jgi:hypothetical protein
MKNSRQQTIKKGNLPSKNCLHCNRPFNWRKKWEKTWEEVKYCSEGCKKNKANLNRKTERIILVSKMILIAYLTSEP